MLLEFLKHNGEVVKVGNPSTMQEVDGMIRDYAKSLNPNFKIPYIRTMETDEGTLLFDVGSYTEFFKLSDKSRRLTIADCVNTQGGDHETQHRNISL
jgi:hypothetical protein